MARIEAEANGVVTISFVLEGDEAEQLKAILNAAGIPTMPAPPRVEPSPPSENGLGQHPGDRPGE